jgi:hypothetical protein
LNPAEQSSISFSVEEDAEIIEVKTTDQYSDLLLATHLLTSLEKDARDAAIVSSIRLEGGQDLSLSITRRESEANTGADLLVKFGYRETEVRRVARLWWQRLRFRLTRERGPGVLWSGAGIPARHIPVVSAVVVICLTGLLAFVLLRSRQTNESEQTSVALATPAGQDRSIASSPVPEAANPPSATQASSPDQSSSQPARRVESDRSTAVKVPSSPTVAASPQARDQDVTRSGELLANLTLGEVKKIYIEIRGDGAFNEFRNKVSESLGSSGVVTAATNVDEADAALKIVVSQSGTQIEASALLVNARGTVLWRGNQRYSGETTKVISEIVRDLRSAIQKETRTKNQ